MPEDVFITTFNTKALLLKEDNTDRYFEGILSVEMKDQQGEITSIDELYKALPAWIDRGGAMSDTHSNRIVGKGINFEKVTLTSKNGIELPAIKILGKIHNSSALDDFIWKQIQTGVYKGLSFGGATKTDRTPVVQSDGSMAYALKDLEIYEVAVCEDPAVAFALITDINPMAKSIEVKKAFHVEEKGEELKVKCDGTKCYINANVQKSKADLGTPIDQDDVPKEVETMIGEKEDKGYAPDAKDGHKEFGKTQVFGSQAAEDFKPTNIKEEEKVAVVDLDDKREDKTKPLPTRWGKLEFDGCESHAKKDPSIHNPEGYCGSIQQHVDKNGFELHMVDTDGNEWYLNDGLTKANEGMTGVGNGCDAEASCADKPKLEESGIDLVEGSDSNADREYFKKECGCTLSAQKDIVGGTENPRGLGAYNTAVNGTGGDKNRTDIESDPPKTQKKKEDMQIPNPANLGDPTKLGNSPSKPKDPIAKTFLESVTEYWRENKNSDNNSDLHVAIKDFVENFKPATQAQITKAYIHSAESEWVADASVFSTSPEGIAQYGKGVEVDKSGDIVYENGNVIFINPFI